MAWFDEHYPKIKSNGVSAQLRRLSTNAQSRVYHTINPEDHDVFFQVDRSNFRLYDPESDPLPIYPGGPKPPPVVEEFIKVTWIPDDFYQRLINEINQLHSEGLPFSLSILIRKLLENLIIDILRKRYGRQQASLYYDTSRRRFHDFSVLLQNLDSHKADFHYIAPDLDTPIIQSINQYRETGNSAAHSIDANLTIEQASQGKDDINYLAQYLLRILQRL